MVVEEWVFEEPQVQEMLVALSIGIGPYESRDRTYDEENGILKQKVNRGLQPDLPVKDSPFMSHCFRD